MTALILLALVSLVTGRTITWSGYNWTVRDSGGRVSGPGPNYWGAGTDEVYVDSNGALHLTIKYINGSWFCTEIYLEEQLGKGYGKYEFDIGSPVDYLGNDIQTVLGLFVYQNDTNEIDIEFSHWGDSSPNAGNADYCVQPSTDASCPLWTQPKGINSSIQVFDWENGKVSFTSTAKGSTSPYHSWVYNSTAKVPVPPNLGLAVHLNLWLNQGNTSMTKAQALDVTITSFRYTSVLLRSTTDLTQLYK